MIPAWLSWTGSSVLTLMLAWYYIDTRLLPLIKKGSFDMTQKITLNVSGMSCMHCSGSVKKAVESIDGTSNVNVDLEGKKVLFDITEKGLIDKVKAAIVFAGFTVN
jgi:copper chaperone CopZ